MDDYVLENFAQDLPPVLAKEFAVAQKLIAPTCFVAISGQPAWKTIPFWFLISANDRSINPASERFMAKRIKATTREIASSHLSPISHPEEVFDLMLTQHIKKGPTDSP